MTHRVPHEELTQVDFATAGADWLADGHHSADVAAQLARAVPVVAQSLDDYKVRELMHAALAGAVSGVRLGPLRQAAGQH